MPERAISVLRLVCIALAALVAYELFQVLTRKDPLAQLEIATVASGAPISNTPTTAQRGDDLPPAIKAKFDRITQSEILGTIVRPLPLALLGIAGSEALIRTPSGQTSFLKEGEEAGGVKLIRVGTNRVLIEHERQTRELMIFSGFGSESLLPKGDKVENKK
jgi:hypothetical protein